MKLAEVIDNSYFSHALLILVTLFFIVSPLGLPVITTTQSVAFYDQIEATEPGSNALILYDVSAAMYPSVGVPTEPMFRHIMEHGLNVIVLCGGPDGPVLLESFLGTPGENKIEEMEGKEYGVDWVNLGYIAGGETMYVSFGSDVHGTVVKDYYGTPVEDIELLENVKSADDFDIVIFCQAGSTAIDATVRVFSSTYDKTLIGAVGSSQYTATLVYYPDLVSGLLNGVKGGGEYESILNKPGPNLAGSDPLTGLMFLNVGLIILGNIFYYMKKWRNEDE